MKQPMKQVMKYVLLICLLFATEAQAASSYVCMGASGAMTVRTKCRRGETRLSASVVQALSPSTVSACRVASGAASTTTGVASLDVYCAPNEYLLTWGYLYNPVALATLSQATLRLEGNIPVGIFALTMVTEIDAQSYPEFLAYTLYVNAVCCAR